MNYKDVLFTQLMYNTEKDFDKLVECLSNVLSSDECKNLIELLLGEELYLDDNEVERLL